MLCLDEVVAKRPTFQKIMEDQVVTDDEISEQSELVISILKKIDDTFSPEQKKVVEDLLAETCVLYAASKYKELQEFKK